MNGWANRRALADRYGPSHRTHEWHGRVVRDSQRWHGEGARLRRQARKARSCAFCHAALSPGRRYYCSDLCMFGFYGLFFSNAQREYVLRRDGFSCQDTVCPNFHVPMPPAELHVDHVVELADGGANFDYANCTTRCKLSHAAKTVASAQARKETGCAKS